jgi:hypothetical protein
MSAHEMPTPRQHASGGPTSPQLPEPSHAERVRTLVVLAHGSEISGPPHGDRRSQRLYNGAELEGRA